MNISLGDVFFLVTGASAVDQALAFGTYYEQILEVQGQNLEMHQPQKGSLSIPYTLIDVLPIRSFLESVGNQILSARRGEVTE